MKAYYNGFDTQEATFKTMSALTPKRAVSLQSSGELYYADAGAPFTGVVSSYRDGVASVVMRGYAVASFKDTPPSVGICKLSVSASGQFVVDETNGTAYTVLGVDNTAKTFEFFI